MRTSLDIVHESHQIHSRVKNNEAMKMIRQALRVYEALVDLAQIQILRLLRPSSPRQIHKFNAEANPEARLLKADCPSAK